MTVASQKPPSPLAARMRPEKIEYFYGQAHLLGENKPLRLAYEKKILHSMILWGPPGTGKTSLALLLAKNCHAHVDTLSAVLGGVKEIRTIVESAKERRHMTGQASVLFVDEIHRFNKAQQDAFLPHVEDGTITLIGATTENPSFELNKALLSRLRVYVLKNLSHEDLHHLLEHTLNDKDHGFGKYDIEFPAALKEALIKASDGDARLMLNLLEILSDQGLDGKHFIIDDAIFKNAIQRNQQRFDKHGDYFFDQVSALHKSVRGSDPDAALYWLASLLIAGCDPLYLARRIVRMASEDIGNADPRALEIALNAWQVQERLGSPEGELALAQAVLYLACAAKSNAVYMAFKQAMEEAKINPTPQVPLHLRNAPTTLMKTLNYGKEYKYPHDEPHAYVIGENYFPENIAPKQYYLPTDRGIEIKIAEKLAFLKSLGRSKK